MKKIIILSACIVISVLQFSCKKEPVAPPPPPPPPPPNEAPVANAGPDQTITLPVNSVTLTGTGTDVDGFILGSWWFKLSGPSCTIESINKLQTVIKNLVVGVYQFQLNVYDNLHETGLDTVVVTVKPALANAGPDQTITLPVNSASLDGSDSQSDGMITSYEWVKISGPAAMIATPNQAQTTVTNLVEGIYKFQLTVSDNLGATGNDTVQITVIPAPAPIYSNWFSLDTVYNLLNEYYFDSTYFYSYQNITPPLVNNYNTHQVLSFVKRSSTQGIVYERSQTIVMVNSGSQTPSFEYLVWFDSNGSEFYLEGWEEGNSSPPPSSALLSAIALVQSYQYRVLVIPNSIYNSLNINWYNYLEIVAALNITP